MDPFRLGHLEEDTIDGKCWPVPKWPPAMPELAKSFATMIEDGTWSHYLGPSLTELEKLWLTYHEVDHVHFCSSGTIATDLALRAVNVAAGDEVILAAYDFPGNFRAIEAIGATPVLVDIVSDGWTINLDAITAAVSNKTKAIIVSHLHGDIAPIQQITAWASDKGIAVIEDACQVPGAIIDGRRAGTIGTVGTFSFGGSKLLTAGRGGALVTQDPRIAQRLKIINDRGNLAFPLSQLQAAVLLPQVQQLDAWNRQRNEGARFLNDALSGRTWLKSSTVLRNTRHLESLPETAYYKFPLMLEVPAAPNSSDQLHAKKDAVPEILESFRSIFLRYLNDEGIPGGEGFRGFAGRSSKRCRSVGALSNARYAAQATILLPHPCLLSSSNDLNDLAAALNGIAMKSLEAIN